MKFNRQLRNHTFSIIQCTNASFSLLSVIFCPVNPSHTAYPSTFTSRCHCGSDNGLNVRRLLHNLYLGEETLLEASCFGPCPDGGVEQLLSRGGALHFSRWRCAGQIGGSVRCERPGDTTFGRRGTFHPYTSSISDSFGHQGKRRTGFFRERAVF